jgi:hypothetical protein
LQRSAQGDAISKFIDANNWTTAGELEHDNRNHQGSDKLTMQQTDEHGAIAHGDRAVAARVLRDVAKMPIADIAELFSVDGTTIYRWLEAKDSEHPMTAVLELLERLTESVEKIAEELSLSA